MLRNAIADRVVQGLGMAFRARSGRSCAGRHFLLAPRTLAYLRICRQTKRATAMKASTIQATELSKMLDGIGASGLNFPSNE